MTLKEIKFSHESWKLIKINKYKITGTWKDICTTQLEIDLIIKIVN